MSLFLNSNYPQYILSVIVLLTLSLGVNGQTAPGGVRTSTELELWLKANDGTQNAGASAAENGDVVTDWLDQSGNGNDGDNSAGGADPVEYLENVYGFYPAVEFNNDDQPITGQLSKATDDYTLFIVASDSSSDGSDNGFFEIAGGGDRHWLIERRYSAGPNYGGLFLPKDSLAIFTVDHPTGTTTADIYVNGQSFVSNITTTNSSSGAAGGTYDFTIGDDDTGGNEFIGTIAEVIVYDATLTAGERQRIESYLAIKYGITLTQDYILSDGSTTIFEIASNPTFSEGVIAIGQDDDSGLDQKVATSKFDSLIIGTEADFTSPNDDASRTTSLSNDAFFVVSHHGGSLGLDSASGGIADIRLGRVWKVNETNSPGAVHVAIPASLGVFSNMVVNSDPTFASGNTEITLSLSGGYYTASYDFADGDFFSFAADPIYPGAVSANIELWLKADGGVTAPGNLVSLWEDQSGNSQNAAGASNAELQDNQTNFNPAIAFDDDPQPFSGSVTTANAEYTVFTVYQDDASADSDQVLWDFDGSQNRVLDDNNFSGGGAFTSNITKGASSLLTIAHDNATTADISINGASFESGYTTVGPSAAGAYNFYLGDDNDGSNRFSGTINELIFYDGAFVGNEIQRIESYLAIRYAITLSTDYLASDGTIIFNRATSAGYLDDIIALGQDNATALSQNVARAQSDLLTIATTSDFTSANAVRATSIGDKGFFFVSSNGGDYKSTMRSGERQLNKIWRVTESSDIGAVFLALDESVGGLVNLVVNTSDPTFSSGNIDVALTLVDGRYTTSYNLDDGDYFTFSTIQVPGNVANGLGVWLKANDGAQEADASTPENGDVLTTWLDQSGNGNDGDDSDPTADPVEFVENAYNFQPAINFNDDDKAIVGTLTKTTGDLTAFIVATNQSTDGSEEAFFEVSISPVNTGDRQFFIENRYSGSANYGGSFIPKDSTIIASVVHPLGSNTVDIFINGQNFVTNASTSA
ncbi:MAG: LamG-like jellyroll fold domain-containing protein, partial [Cyclobacteriaceae bacterium]